MFLLPTRLFLCTAALLGAGAALAQPATESAWGMGLGVNLKQKAYAGMGTRTTVIPLLSYENRWVRVAGPVLDLKLPAHGPLVMALRARYAFEDGYEPDDAPVLNGMAERKSGRVVSATKPTRAAMVKKVSIGAQHKFRWPADLAGLVEEPSDAELSCACGTGPFPWSITVDYQFNGWQAADAG